MFFALLHTLAVAAPGVTVGEVDLRTKIPGPHVAFVPMRDGVKLHTVWYACSRAPVPAPSVLPVPGAHTRRC